MSRYCLMAAAGGLLTCAAFAADTKDAAPAVTTESAATASVTLPPDESATPAQLGRAAAEAAAHAPDLSKVVEIRHADGSREWIFNGQAEESMTLVHDADGKPHLRCSGIGALHQHVPAAAQEHGNER